MNLAPERRLYNSNVTASSVSYIAWVSLVPVYWGQTCLFVFNWHSWWFIRTSRCIWLKFWIAFGCLPLNPCPHVVQWNDPWLHTAHQMCIGFIFVYIYCGCSIQQFLGPFCFLSFHVVGSSVTKAKIWFFSGNYRFWSTYTNARNIVSTLFFLSPIPSAILFSLLFLTRVSNRIMC